MVNNDLEARLKQIEDSVDVYLHSNKTPNRANDYSALLDPSL